MEKVTAAAYVFLHLTRTDFITAFIGWFLRCVSDWYSARHKVTFRGEGFDTRVYFLRNWDRILVSNFFALGLLLILPEVVIVVASWATGHPVSWNSGFSGLVGLLGFEIINALQKGGKRRLTRLISGEESLAVPGPESSTTPDEGRDEVIDSATPTN